MFINNRKIIVFCFLAIHLSGCSVQTISTSPFDKLDGYQYEDIENENQYWYGTGESLPIGINYHTTSLLESLLPGDIIYEDTGGFGITGHIAIVEAICFSAEYSQYYIRIIEAIDIGVSRSILTPQRFSQKIDSAFRVRNVSLETINHAIAFVISQLNKPYEIALWKNADTNNPDWYCSELVWAAYYHQNVFLDIDDNDNRGSIVFPREIIECDLLEQILI